MPRGLGQSDSSAAIERLTLEPPSSRAISTNCWTPENDIKRPIIEEEKIEITVRNIRKEAFTVLDFIKTLERLYPEDWKKLAERFGLFGEKKRYTVSTCLSNRLDLYSHKPHSILAPFTKYSEGRFVNYRKTTDGEGRVFGSPMIAVFRKKEETNK
jgi:hypothetical protein